MTRWGPQPHEGLVSVICESFGCTPDAAERQDWATVQAVLDYRAALAAREAFNLRDRKRAFDVLQANPHLTEMLAMMNRAQRGLPLHGGDLRREGLSVAEQHAPPADGEEDEAD